MQVIQCTTCEEGVGESSGVQASRSVECAVALDEGDQCSGTEASKNIGDPEEEFDDGTSNPEEQSEGSPQGQDD